MKSNRKLLGDFGKERENAHKMSKANSPHCPSQTTLQIPWGFFARFYSSVETMLYTLTLPASARVRDGPKPAVT